MSRTFTLAVERVADDRRFAERFRTDPARALRRYRLDAGQVEAIKAGTHEALWQHGFDVAAFERGVRHGWRPHLRKLVAGATIVGATLGLLAAPASAATDGPCKICPGQPLISGVRVANLRQVRMGRAIRVGRVLIRRSSIRTALARHGIRARAGRASLRQSLRRFAERYGDEKSVYLVGPELTEPLLIAPAP